MPKKIIPRLRNTGRRFKPKFPDLQAAAYAKKLDAEILRGFELIKKYLYNSLPEIDSLQRIDTAEDADLINIVINGILKRYFGGMVSKDRPNLVKYAKKVRTNLVNPMQKNVDTFNKTQFKNTFKQLSGVDPLKFAPGLSDALKIAGDINVNKIVTVNSNYFDNIRELVNRSLRKGDSVKELKKSIIELTRTTENRAKLIAIDQVQKLNSDLERVRAQANGIKRYFWRTRKNLRTRQDHKDLEGAVIDYSYPPITVTTGKRAGETNHAGQDIDCKCWSELVIEDLIGKTSANLKEGLKITRKLISVGRIPGYTLKKLNLR